MSAGIVVSNDLFFSGSLCERAKVLGKSLEMLSLEAALTFKEPQAVSLLLIDLSSLKGDIASAIGALKQHLASARLVAFGPHVHEALLQTAREAGCDEVVTRGQLNQFAGRYINQL